MSLAATDERHAGDIQPTRLSQARLDSTLVTMVFTPL